MGVDSSCNDLQLWQNCRRKLDEMMYVGSNFHKVNSKKKRVDFSNLFHSIFRALWDLYASFCRGWGTLPKLTFTGTRHNAFLLIYPDSLKLLNFGQAKPIVKSKLTVPCAGGKLKKLPMI